jgi:BA14K-like protein
MSISMKLLPIGALALAFAAAPAEAAPAASATALAVDVQGSAATQIQWGYRRHPYHRGYPHRGYRRGWGAAPWLGLGAGIVIGSIIANEAYRPRRGYYYDDYEYDGPYYYPSGYSGDPRKICAENFRSFEWNSGLYTTYEGERRLCPYLK